MEYGRIVLSLYMYLVGELTVYVFNRGFGHVLFYRVISHKEGHLVESTLQGSGFRGWVCFWRIHT